MKTDIRDSTMKFRMLPEVDLNVLLTEHREFVSRLAQAHHGRIVKEEGDGYWVIFPSVTAAALAAMSMQEELRLAQPGKGDDRVSMRIVLTLGDVLHAEGGLLGDAVVLATRIESIAPPDEIYASASAWLAMNQAEVRAAFVDTFTLKGFPDPVAVYRIEQTHRMRMIPDQYIVITDLKGFEVIAERSRVTLIERILDQLLELVRQACAEFSGTHRSTTGDSYLLTFPDPARAMAGAERLAEGWAAFQHREGIRCPINAVVHKGTLYGFRSYLLSPDLYVAANLERATSRLESGDASIFLTGQVRQSLVGPPWEGRLHPVDIGLRPPRLAGIEIYRLGPATPDPH
ncbi:MAG: adenylate/guanylate cyclase domain-containing protein [Candidatus Rokuibacteriota bacterium]